MWQGFESGYVERILQDTKQRCVWRQFPEIKQNDSESSLQLADYLLVGPQKYYSRDAFREVHDWLVPHVQQPSKVFLASLFRDTTGRIDQAFREMREINNDPRHEQATVSYTHLTLPTIYSV